MWRIRPSVRLSIRSKIGIEIFILKNRRASLDPRENWFSDSHNLLKAAK